MRTSFRTGLGAVIVTAVVLSVPAISPAANAGSTARSARTHSHSSQRHYTRIEANRIFQRVQEALTPKHAAPRTLGDPLPRRDLTLLLRQAQQARGSMTARQQSIIDNTNSRPVPDAQGCTDYTQGIVGLGGTKWTALASAHFCVHYNAGPGGAAGVATPQQAQLTLTTMENVYAKEITGLGFHAPLPDSDGLVDVFLDQLGNQGYYGFCTTDNQSSQTSTAWCGLDNDFAVSEFGALPANSLDVTAAHEFFHAIQFGYNDSQDNWLMEGTAVWMEDQVYPNINDYLQYLPYSQIAKPRQSLDLASSPEWYGDVTFWKFLSEHFRDVSIIRQVWGAAAVSAGNRNALQAVLAVLAARHYSFGTEFARYAEWNTLPPGSYGDRARFPKPGFWATSTLSKGRRDTGVQKVSINHLASAPLILHPASNLRRRSLVNIIINGPDRSHGTQSVIQVRYKNGKIAVFVMSLGGAGNGNKFVTFNPRTVRSVIVTMTNASSGYNGQLFTVRARVKY